MAEPVSRAGATLAAPSSALASSPLLVAVCLAFCIAVLAALLVWRLKRRPAAVAAAAAAAKAPAVPALPPGVPQPPSTPDPSLPQPLSATQTAEVAAALASTSPASPASPPPQEPPPPPLAPPALPRKLVRAALPDGEHHVQFGDGSAYYGEWRGGRMHGRGVFEWPTGERYEGEWADGQENGTAMFTGAEGGTYYGSWVGGLMHGKCVYRPAGAEAAGPQVVYLQQYDHGRLVSQQVLRVAEKDIRKRQQKKEGKKKVKREAKQLRQYRAPKPGEPVYKGHRSYDLMRALQLGITFSIAQAGLAAASGELQERDFSEETTQHFPPGSETAPFKWKDYAPRVFHRLRQSFGIDNTDYLLSLTGEAALRLLGSPGKSGSVFFLSDDDRFLVKTVRHSEMRLLLSLIPLYYRHVQANPGTLLTRFYGVHRLTPIIGRQVRFVVMGNVLPSDLRLHRKFDLKGSTYGRTVGADVRATNPYATLKDEDLDMQLILPQEQYGGVLRQLRRDLDLLQRLHVIDYSLLLGVHFARWGNAGWHPPFRDWPADPDAPAAASVAAATAADGSESTISRPVTPVATSVTVAVPAAVPAPAAAATPAAGPAVPHLAPMQDSTPAAAQAAGGSAHAQWPGDAAAAAAAAGAALATHSSWRLSGTKSLSEPSSSPASPASPSASFTASRLAPAGPSTSFGPAAPAGQRQRLPIEEALRHGSWDAADELAAFLEGLQHPGPSAATPASATAAASTLAGGPPADAQQAAAAASVVQAAFLSRQQARRSATAALQSVAGSAGQQALPSIPETAAAAGGPGTAASQASSALLDGEVHASPFAASTAGPHVLPPPAASPAAPLVAVAERDDPGHWWLDSRCGLPVPTCFSAAAAGAASLGGELWARQPSLPPAPAASAEEAQQQCILLGSGSLASGGRTLDPSVAAQLGRLLSRRGSGEHESAGRAVPAVAVRRTVSGALQYEPVLLFFGIIDFLQDYTLRKHLERWWKAAVHDGGAVSVADPRFYGRRFWHAMQRLLLSSSSAPTAAAAGQQPP